MLRRLGIRAKVLAVLAVPIIVLLAAGAYISNTAYQQVRSASVASQAVQYLDRYAPLGAALQKERSLAEATTRDKAAIATARKATDDALATVKPFIDNLDLSQYSTGVAMMFRSSIQAYDKTLPQTRYLVDTDARPDVIASVYTSIIVDNLDLVGQLSETLDNRDLASYLSAYHLLGQTGESLSNELTEGLAIVAAKQPSAGATQTFATQTASTEVDRSALRAALDAIGNESLFLSTAYPTTDFQRERDLLSNGLAESASHVDPAAWNTDIQTQLTTLSALGTKILSTAESVAQSAQTQARDAALATIGGAALAVALSLLLALVVSRSIIVPLRRLTSATADVREQLPNLVEQMAVPGQGPSLEIAQIPVTSSDEVGELAVAFNAVNSTTLQIAQEQAALRGSIAEMFINVARRDQVLLNRQLSFIDSLERSEEDPNTLANLFRLDHLATRMRRNAESLLVLAGIDTGRRVRDAMPLSDVIRTASSEIEQYDRIELELAVDPQMHGFNALGAAHLLAELFENATVFSEPETPVEVKTGVLGDHVVVQVLDHGLGMSTADLAAANVKIRSTSASDSLGEQRLGLFVVGRIASRLGAGVVLSHSETGTGTVTTVSFPATLFESTEGALYGVRPSASIVESAEADGPLVEAVDLAMLTDGETSLGLPRRRQRSGEDSSEFAPPDIRPLPQRGGTTFDESKIVLPGLAEATLAPELSTGVPDWTPASTAEPSGDGLPSRSHASTSAEHQDDVTDPPVAPAAPETRGGLFSRFRTRGELPSPAPADVPTVPADDEPSTFAIPGLVPDGTGETPAEERAVWAPTWEQAAQPLIGGVPTIEPYSDEALPQHELDTDAPEPAEMWSPVQARDEEPVETPLAAEHWAHVAEPPSAYTEFSAFGEYANHAASTGDDEAESTYVPTFRSEFSPLGFGPVLDEARAWNAGERSAEAVHGHGGEALNGHASAEPVVEHPSWEAPVTAEPGWQAPVAEPAPWDAPGAEPLWQAPVPQVPASPFVDSESPTQLFDPIEAEQVADASSREPDPGVPPHVETGTPPWAAAAPTDQQDAPAFTELVQGELVQGASADGGSNGGHRRWSLFGRRRHDAGPVAVAVVGPTEPSAFDRPFRPTHAPEPVSEQPQRTSVWGIGQDVGPTAADPTAAPAGSPFSRPPAPVEAGPDVPESAQPSAPTNHTWSPPPESVQEIPEPVAPRQVASFFRPVVAPSATPIATPGRPAVPSSWSPDWAARTADQGSQPAVEQPSAAPRIGALDDEVAAMLALRSDIQEQALSELSQLSAYRPSSQTNGPAVGSLTKRVPHEVPAAPALIEATSGAPRRDAEQLRSRFASYQSGTTRGRRAQAGPSITPSRVVDDPLVDDPLADPDQASTPPTPSW